MTCEQTDNSDLQGPKIITGPLNQMIRWLLKSFCLVLTASIFFCHVTREVTTMFLWGCNFSICALSRLRPVIFMRETLRCRFQGFGDARQRSNRGLSKRIRGIFLESPKGFSSPWTSGTDPRHFRNKLLLWLGASAPVELASKLKAQQLSPVKRHFSFQHLLPVQ